MLILTNPPLVIFFCIQIRKKREKKKKTFNIENVYTEVTRKKRYEKANHDDVI